MPGPSTRQPSAFARKAGVVVLYGGYASAAALWTGSGGLKPWPIAVLVVFLLLAVFGAMGLLFRGTRYWKWGNCPDDKLDEFEIASRNAAYKSAYILVATFSLLGMLLVRIGGDIFPIKPSETSLELIFWGWFLVVTTLPAAILAWIENPVEDEDEGSR